MIEPDADQDDRVRQAMGQIQSREAMPHSHVIVAVTFFVLVGFSGITAWVLVREFDQTVVGSVLQTWNNLAVGAGAFWLGSSLGGKMKP